MFAGNPHPEASYQRRAGTARRQFTIGRDAVVEIGRLEDQRRRLLDTAETLDVPRLHLTYERDINTRDPMPLLKRLAEFLDIDPACGWRSKASVEPGATRFHKLVSDDLRRVIENYEAVAADPAMARFL